MRKEYNDRWFGMLSDYIQEGYLDEVCTGGWVDNYDEIHEYVWEGED